MRKILSLSIFVILIWSNSLIAKDRWIILDDSRWDMESAVNIGGNSIRLFYEYPFSDNQREYFRKNKIFNERDLQNIMFERDSVVIKCSNKQYAIVGMIYYDKNQEIIDAPVSIKQSDWEFSFISPDSRMESLAKNACRYFKLKY